MSLICSTLACGDCIDDADHMRVAATEDVLGRPCKSLDARDLLGSFTCWLSRRLTLDTSDYSV